MLFAKQQLPTEANILYIRDLVSARAAADQSAHWSSHVTYANSSEEDGTREVLYTILSEVCTCAPELIFHSLHTAEGGRARRLSIMAAQTEFSPGVPPLPSYEEAISYPNPPDFATPPPNYFNKATEQPYLIPVYSPTEAASRITTPPVVTVQRVIVQPSFTNQPVQIQCPACMQLVVTRLEHSSGTATWLICAGLFIFGCAYGCCLIPFCMDDLKDVTHYCPNCNSVLGVYKRL
ncbi:hypothetical protein GN956_G17907 [Arapaima gigas]